MIPERDDDFVSSAELANRPRSILTLAVGPTWALVDEYGDVAERVVAARKVPGSMLEFSTHQDGTLGSALISIGADQIVSVFEVTEKRYIADLRDRKAKEQIMREAAAAQGRPMPPGMV